jgi:ribosome-associated protein
MEKLKFIKEILEEKKAEDIAVINVSKVTNIADYFVIATANSTVHARALAEFLVEKLEEKGWVPHHVEGLQFGNWILVDLMDVIVHIFTPEWREKYGLEWIWSEAVREEI